MNLRLRSCLYAVILLLSLLVPLTSPQPASAAPYTVTFTADNLTVGSLRYAITQANLADGPHTIDFNIPQSDPGFTRDDATHGWWIIRLNSALPQIKKAHIYIDGTTQTTNQGDTNPGQVGTGGTVGCGTPIVTLPTYNRPEIEITPATISTVPIGFITIADNTTLRGLAIYGFGSQGASISNAQVRVASNGYRTTIENCLIGVRANGADPGFDSKSAGISLANMTSGTVKNNYIGNNIMGIYLSGTDNWTISGNEIFQNALRYSSYDGMDLSSNTNNIVVNGNLIRQSGGTGIDSYNGAGQFTISNNTVTKSGAANGNEKCGMRIFGSGSRISGNVVTENGGAGIIVPPLFGTINSDNNTISRNSCYANGGLGIDLIRLGSSTDRGDGVNFNDGIFIDTWGNRGIDFPILTAASKDTNNLYLSGYVGTDNTSNLFSGCRLEFFTAATDPTGYGEGRTFLGYFPMDSGNNSFTCTLVGAGAGLSENVSITATATSTVGKNDTSEFSLCRQLNTIQNPVLSLHVTPPAYGYAGQSVTYSGSVRNVSASTAYNNALTWQLPPEFTYLSSSGGTYYPSTHTVKIEVPSITAGQEITGWVTVSISPSVPDGTIVTAGSGLTWQNIYGATLPPVYHSSSIVVYSTPQLNTQLSAPTYAFAGENVIYNGVLHNYSSGTAMNTVLKFELPADNMTFVSASHGAVVSGNTVTFNLGNITPGSDMSGSMTVLVDGLVSDGTSLQMTTVLSWDDAAGNHYGPQQRYYDLTVYQFPQLTITKEGPPDAVIGSTYKFTGSLTNIGRSDAKNIELIDYLPAGLTFAGSSHSAEYDSDNRTVTWHLGSLSSGNSIPGWINVLVDNSTPSGTRFINNFQATWTDSLGYLYGPVSASKEITAYSNPQLTLTKEGPDEATVGSYITFTGSLSNVGGRAAVNTVLVDYLPAGLNYVGSSQSAVYDPASHTVTWQIGPVGSGASMLGWVTVQVDASVTNGARLTNTFGVTWEDGSGNALGPATADKQVIARTNPLLSITKTGPTYGRPNSDLTFTINVNNVGGLSAQNITLVDSLSDNYTYVSSNPAGTSSGGNVSWNLGSLAPEAGTSVSLTVHVSAETTNNTPLANSAMVTWKDAAGNTFGPTSTSFVTTIYSTPKLTVTKTGPATANPGDNCTFNIEVRNVADHDALNTVVADIIPSRMSYVSSSDGGVYDDVTGMVSWTPVTIEDNSGRTFSVTLHVDHSLIESTVLTNTAMATWQDEWDVVYGPVSGSCNTSVTPFPALTILLDGPSSGQVGSALTFTARIENKSDTIAADNVMAQFIIPSGCSYNSSSDGGINAGGTVTWNLGSLAALGSREVTVMITVTTAPSGSDVISTSATVWQYESASHGPKFASAVTGILPAPVPPPAPPPTPELSPLDMMPMMPRSSGTVNSVPTPSPMPLPYIYIQSAGLSTVRVAPNNPVTVTAIFTNKGTVNGSTAVKLYVNGYSEAAQGVALASGQSRTVSFDIVKAEPGQYQVYVNGTSAGSFTVEDTYSSDIVLTASLACILAALVLGTIMIMRRRRSYY